MSRKTGPGGGIKSRERVRKYGEVFTPERIVRDMCDLVEKESADDDALAVITRTWLEPACGTGNFLAEIFRRKLAVCETPLDAVLALDSLYGIDVQPDNAEETRARLKTMFRERFDPPAESVDALADLILKNNIVCGDFLTGLTSGGDKIWFLSDEGGCFETENGKKSPNIKKSAENRDKNRKIQG